MQCMNEISRVLKPGGILVLTVPSRGSLIRFVQKSVLAVNRLYSSRPKFEYIGHSSHVFSAMEIKRMLEQCGLQSLEFRLFAPLKWLPFNIKPLSSLFAIAARKNA